MGSEEIFTLEPKDAVSRLSSALEICSELKRSYFIYKQLAAKKAPKVQPWDIQSSALFERLDLFMVRWDSMEGGWVGETHKHMPCRNDVSFSRNSAPRRRTSRNWRWW